jgi:membrane protease YdiL (CAAX protease family)
MAFLGLRWTFGRTRGSGCYGLACRIPRRDTANALDASRAVGSSASSSSITTLAAGSGRPATTGNHLFPSTVLGHYPLSIGWLHSFDIVFGLGLDTYTEEVVFRRCARHVFKAYLGDGLLLVLVTSLLFGAYHWWSGVGNILAAMLMGVLFMLFFQRSGSLWPVVISHYLTDVADFA